MQQNEYGKGSSLNPPQNLSFASKFTPGIYCTKFTILLTLYYASRVYVHCKMCTLDIIPFHNSQWF